MQSDDWRAHKAADSEWRAVLLQDPCVWCGRLESEIPGGHGRKWRIGPARKMTVDHIHVRGFGPRHHWTNEAPSCWNCNHSREDRGLLANLLVRQELAARFAPGPNNERNRQWKAARRRAIERQIARAL